MRYFAAAGSLPRRTANFFQTGIPTPPILLLLMAGFFFIAILPLSVCHGKENSQPQNPILARGDHNYPPYEFLDERGNPAGYNVDIFLAVAEAMKIETRIRLGPWEQVRKELETGKIDVLIGMFNSNERDQLVDFSKPHLIISQAIFVRRNSSIESENDLRGKEIIVQDGDIMHDYVRSKNLSARIITVKDQPDGLRLLASGKHDCFLGAEPQGLYILKKFDYDNVITVGGPLFAAKYGFAVHQGDIELLSRLNQGLERIKDSGKYQVIYDKWFGVMKPEGIPFGKIVRYALIVLVPLFLIFCASFLWSWSLRRLVRSKTRDLRESESKFRSLFELSPLAIVLTETKTGGILDVNPKFAEMAHLKGQEMIGRNAVQLGFFSHEDRVEIMRRLDERGQVNGYEIFFNSRDGSTLHCLLFAKRLKIARSDHNLLIFMDMTERKQLEQQLGKAQRLQSLGRLAGGVAHDLNNTLTVILGYAELAMARQKEGQPLDGELSEIRSAATHSSGITRQLLAFARRQTIAPKVLDLNETVGQLIKMIKHLIGENINLSWKPTQEAAFVKIDPAQIDQILANLCVNSRDAIEDVGKIEIKTRNITVRNDNYHSYPTVVPGPYVVLMVSDNGVGMDKEVMEQVFEPFFTTKKDGQGTGLGLATVYGIVKQNRGAIQIESKPGEGTTFKVYIPRYEEELSAPEPKSLKITEETGNETVLVVEDDPAILELLKKILTRLGYEVLAAGTPKKAIEISKNFSDKIHLLVTDVVMPEMNGRELSKRITAQRAETRTLFMSGYTADVLAPHGILNGKVAFIQKPVTFQEMSAKIREVLKGGKNEAGDGG